MILGTKKTLYEHITEALLEKPATVAGISITLKNQKVSATVQGVYKALRELIAEDIIVKQKKQYLVNSVWRRKLSALVTTRQPFSLSAGESVDYKFKKLDHLDAFWKHTIADIETEVGSFPVFHFTPHQYWPYVPGRKESEQEYYASRERHRTPIYTVIGGDTPMDKLAKDSLKQPLHHVHLDPKVFGSRDHISSIGPYVVITRVSIPLAKHVQSIYEKAMKESSLETLLPPLFKKFGSVQMIVEHNEQKARILRKRLARDFHIPKELREQFDLF